jgi:glycosyltransferase involved in cell wall biosynthesis
MRRHDILAPSQHIVSPPIVFIQVRAVDMRPAPGSGYNDRAAPRLSPLTRKSKLGRSLLLTSPTATKDDGGRSRSLVKALLNSGWAMRGMIAALLVAWCLVKHGVAFDSRFEHAGARSGSPVWRSDGTDSRLDVPTADAARPVGICTNLAGLRLAATTAGAGHAFPSFPRTKQHHPPAAPDHGPYVAIPSSPAVLVVVVVMADGADDDDQNADDHAITKRDHNRSATCAQVRAWVEMLRKSQTLVGFGIEMLVVDRAETELQPRPRDCPGVRHFDAGSVIAAEETSGGHEARAPGLGETTRRPPNLRDFVVFLDATKQGPAIRDLQATTLEKMVLAAKGRHVDLVSIESPADKVDAVDLVCLATPRHPHAHARPTCHARGAPVLLRVPSWLLKVQLAGWVGAVGELITGAASAGAHAISSQASPGRLSEARRVSDGLASLFCACDEAVTAHALQESQMLLGFAGTALESRSGTSSPSACVRVRALLPHLHASRAAFSVAYETQSRERVVLDRHDGNRHVDDTAAMAERDIASAQRRSNLQTRFSLHQGRHAAAPSPTVASFLLLVPWLEHGGADQFNVNLARALTGFNIRVVVVTTLSSKHPTARDFYGVTPDVFHLPHLITSPRDTPGVLDVLTHLIVSRTVQVVMISHSAFGYKLLSHLRIALVAMRHGHVRFVDFVHLEEMEWGGGGYAALSVAHAQHLDHTFAASQHVAAWMRERASRRVRESTQSEQHPPATLSGASKENNYGDDDRISVAYIGVDTHALRPLAVLERAKLRSDMLQPLGQVSVDTPIIAYIARMVDQKFPEFYFEIVRQLREDRHMDFVSLAIGDGPKLAELRANISHHPMLKPTVLTLGMLSHTATTRALAAADVLLLPSQNEGISLAVYEAMALGVSPVVSAVGGQCELVANGAGACISLDLGGTSGAAKAFVDELERLLMSRELMGRRSRMARQRVEREFDVTCMMRALARGLCR